MKYYFKLFHRDIILRTPPPATKPLEFDDTIYGILFLIARFGDSLLLTRLSYLIKKYFPCWCHFNSKFFREEKTFQRPSHQILVQNSDSPTNEPLSAENLLNSNDLPTQQQLIRKNHRRFRLRFQFVPIWSNKRERLFKQNR
jgi:hypothetical protein